MKQRVARAPHQSSRAVVWPLRGYRVPCLLALFLGLSSLAQAAPLSDPQVDAYNMRVGTQTFSGLYQFTEENLLVETARAITNMGSDTIKMYLGSNYSGKYHTNLSGITSLLQLARNEPNCRYTLDMPFRRIIAWAYPFSTSDAPFGDGNYTPTEQANDYREMYDLTRYLLTNYNNSGKSFYLGHWEGDGYLSVNNWSTNPSPSVVSNMILWEINRQKAVDDAKAATVNTCSNVSLFYYLEVNRVRDAMLNGTNNNVRMVNAVLPYVTNIDFVSYSSYDGMNLSSSDLYATLRYIETNTPPPLPAKAAVLPPCRLWIGEYGWGSQTPAQQEPTVRSYWQRLLNYPNTLPFILFWEIYDNETNSNGSFKYFYLIDPSNNKVPCWYLHSYFINNARLATARFLETNGRLPSDTEFVSLVYPALNQPLPAPVPLTVTNTASLRINNACFQISGRLTQGLYGDDRASVSVFWGPQDGGAVRANWAQCQIIGINTNFNPAIFSQTLTNLAPNTTYYFRFYATNVSSQAWAPASAQFTTPSPTALNPSDYSCRLKLTFSGYNRGETLTNFPALVSLGTNLPGFAYAQFASPAGGDLRFTDAGGLNLVPHEIDEWNTNGTSLVWVRVPQLSRATDSVCACWGNPLATNLPSSVLDGSVWSADHLLVWHLKESGLPYADSAQQHPAALGAAPASATGQIGRGCSFSGSQYLDAGIVNLGNTFTLSAWVKIASSINNLVTIWANKVGGWNANGLALFVNAWGTTNKALRLETGDGTPTGGTSAASPTNIVSFGQWHLLSAVVDRTALKARLYMDGADITQYSPLYPNFDVATNINLGRVLNNASYFSGVIDEARIEATTRSSNWVWASWMTVASNATLASYSAVTQQVPSLTIDPRAGGYLLSWPASGVGFAPFTATNLLPPVVWSLATNQPSLVGTQWQIALPPDAGRARFFRLQPLD